MLKKLVILSSLTIALLWGGSAVLAAGGFGLHDTAAGAGYGTTGAPSITQTVGLVVQVVLGFVALLFFGLTLYGGIIWMTARGSEEKVTQAKGILEAAIIGLVIVAASYAISRFVINRISATEKVGSCNYSAGCQDNTSKDACDKVSGTWTEDGACPDTSGQGSCTVSEGEASPCFNYQTKASCDAMSGTWVKDGTCE